MNLRFFFSFFPQIEVLYFHQVLSNILLAELLIIKDLFEIDFGGCNFGFFYKNLQYKDVS